jgi:hypothetical protein
MRRLFPVRHFTTYEANGLRYFHTWRQWGKRIWSQTRFPVGPAMNTSPDCSAWV